MAGRNGLMRPPIPGRSLPTNPFYADLSPSAQTAYAQLIDHAMTATMNRTIADLSGAFVKKVVAGKEYWYFQYRELRELDEKGSVKQIYLGPRSERLDRMIHAKQDAKAVTKNPTPSQLQMQAGAAVALGNFAIASKQLKVLKRLDEYGYFCAGGVLVGTHAFSCYGNMCGVAWGNFQMTHDIDFAYGGPSLSIALPSDLKIDVHDAISSLEMGFLPSAKLNGTAGGTYVVPEDPDFRLDFLTTCGRDEAQLINFPNLNLAMVPLKFMEFSLQDIQQTVVISSDGAVLVNIPHPARYALHKLIVAGERKGAFATKVQKDLWQAGALLTYLVDRQSHALAEAWVDITKRGKGWRTRFEAGLRALQAQLPETIPVIERCRQAALDFEEINKENDGNDGNDDYQPSIF
jgi:hypothetical protein